MKNKTATIVLANPHWDWVNSQPRSFNLSKFIRTLMDKELGIEYEVKQNENETN